VIVLSPFGRQDDRSNETSRTSQKALRLARPTSDNLTSARPIELAKEYISPAKALEKTKSDDSANVGKRADKRSPARIEREAVAALTRNAIFIPAG
jgi:hypothetical protein